MIRVCFTVDAPFLGGAEYYVSRLATGLDRREFAVSVLVRAAEGDDPLAAWATGLVDAGITVVRVSMRLPRRPGDALRVWRSLEALAPHIVHVNVPGPYSGQNLLLAPLARAAGARVVTTEHLPMVPRLWKRHALKRVALRFVDLAVTMTRANAGYLVREQGVPAEKVRVVCNGVERRPDKRPHAAARDPATAFVFVGNVIAHKGLHVTLKACSQLGMPWTLRVAGDGPDLPRCRRLAVELGIESRVAFLGRQEPNAIGAILDEADALVLPSSMEGLPYAILEAMERGLPVIAGDVYGVPEAVVNDETGLLVPPEDVTALAAALGRLAGDATLRARLGANARARFEQSFTLERQLRAMSGLYRNLVGKRA